MADSSRALGSEAVAGPGVRGFGGSPRSLWRKARQQLSEYELQLSELQFELGQEARACHAQKEATARLLKEAAQLRAKKAQMDHAAIQEYARLQALKQACEQEKVDSKRLLHQLNISRERLQDLKRNAASCQLARDHEVSELELHNAMLQEYLRQLRSHTCSDQGDTATGVRSHTNIAVQHSSRS